jgi:hypothetical protein
LLSLPATSQGEVFGATTTAVGSSIVILKAPASESDVTVFSMVVPVKYNNALLTEITALFLLPARVYPLIVLALIATCTPVDSRTIPNEVATVTVSINAGGIELSLMSGCFPASISVTAVNEDPFMENKDPASPSFPTTSINGTSLRIFTAFTVKPVMETLTAPAVFLALINCMEVAYSTVIVVNVISFETIAVIPSIDLMVD